MAGSPYDGLADFKNDIGITTVVVSMEKGQIRISAKDLGSLALENCCKIFHAKLKLNDELLWPACP